MSSIAWTAPVLEGRWLRGAGFDLVFIVGVFSLSVGVAAFVIAYPLLFWPVLLIDLWVLGYHHVIATYTRLCFDRQSMREHWFLVFGLFPIIAVCTLAAAWLIGLWVIISVYFYWQWFHYTRQNWGISRAYRAKDRDALYEDGWLDQAIFYALPVLGLLHRSDQHPEKFLSFPIKVVPVAHELVPVCAAVTVALLGYWILRRIVAWREGRLAVVHTLYMTGHFAIFAIGYVVIDNITIGWLAINIWHNAQYILFVWLFNTRRFKDGVDPNARFLSYISQPGRLWLYLLACVAITGVFYWGVVGTLNAMFFAGLAATIIVYQIVNFHHYIVDAVIWKLRKGPVRQTLGLTDHI
jgi:hypothetical protein